MESRLNANGSFNTCRAVLEYLVFTLLILKYTNLPTQTGPKQRKCNCKSSVQCVNYSLAFFSISSRDCGRVVLMIGKSSKEGKFTPPRRPISSIIHFVFFFVFFWNGTGYRFCCPFLSGRGKERNKSNNKIISYGMCPSLTGLQINIFNNRFLPRPRSRYCVRQRPNGGGGDTWN